MDLADLPPGREITEVLNEGSAEDQVSTRPPLVITLVWLNPAATDTAWGLDTSL
jgi:hypothetical protein